MKALLSANLSSVKADSSLLSDADTIQITNSAKPDKKAKITFSQTVLDGETLDKAKQRLDDLLKTSSANKIIKRLEAHTDINQWVSDGFELHKQYETNTCEFCGNEITDQRIKEIEAHFSDEYKIFKTRLTSADQWLKDRYVKLGDFPPESSVYEEFKADYNVKISALKTATDAVNEEIKKWSAILKKKIDNPFDTSLVVDSISAA
ncbi:MAG: AAA family ATPase, partial [Methylobacter sp.]